MTQAQNRRGNPDKVQRKGGQAAKPQRRQITGNDFLISDTRSADPPAQIGYLRDMTLTLPDQPMPLGITPDELRLELACALYSRGKLTKVRGADLASVDFFTFQQALKERQISTYTIEDLNQEVQTLNESFPENPIPLPRDRT